jgi:hypothetical protein
MGRASPIQSSFNAGEFSPRLDGRQDIAKYGSACKILEGFIPLIQGPAMRRAGFRFVAEVKDSTQRAWLVRFEFNTQQAYVLEFGHQYIRFFANHGQVVVSGVAAYNGATAYAVGDLVLQGGTNYYCIKATTGNAPPNATYWYALAGAIYEIPSPYSAADLTDSDGNFTLRIAESADVLYLAHTAYAPRKLSRLGATKWVMSTVQPAGGPFQPVNITATTVYSDSVSGAAILTASSGIFTPSHVGSLFYLEQKSASTVHSWEPGKAVIIGDVRRSDGKNYKALTAGTTGGNKPTHIEGAVYDGDTGVQWQFTDPGFGCVQIMGYTSATQVDGLVVSPFPAYPASQLPEAVVTAPNATTRWAFAAWSDSEGWPSQVAFYRSRLCFGRKQRVWLSVAGDYETFTARDISDLVTTDMAITTDLKSSKVNDLQWMEPISNSVDALVCGTAGSEFVLKSMTENQPFGTDNNTAPMISTLGSRNAQPVNVGNVLLFVQRAGSKLRDIDYDSLGMRYQSIDQTMLAEHLPKPGVPQIVYQQEPYSLLWGARSDGLLIGMTYSREQYPDAPHGGWHRHPLGGAGAAEALCVIPAPDSSRDELWAITRRTINGVTKRYVEWLEWERRPNDDPADAFYLDCGLTLNNAQAVTLTPGAGATVAHAAGVPFVAGAAVFSAGDVGRQIHRTYSTTDADGVVTYTVAKATITAYTDSTHVAATVDAAFPSLSTIAAGGWRLTVSTVTGLGHLEGQAVDVLVDGAAHPQRVVSGGAITLQAPASKVHAGLAIPAKLQTMRLNAGAQDGTSQGKKSRVNHCVVRLLETGSLQYGHSFADLMDVELRTPLDAMDNPHAIFSGDVLLDWPGEYDTSPWLCFSVNQPLPATIVSLMPQVMASDKG